MTPSKVKFKAKVKVIAMEAGKRLLTLKLQHCTISELFWAGILISVLVFVSRDFELGRKFGCDL